MAKKRKSSWSDDETNHAEPTPQAAPPPATGTGTSTGTTALTVSAVTGVIHIPSTVAGTGVPANTQVVAGPSAGGAGTYTTNQNTTLAAVALTFTPTGSTAFFPDFTVVAPPPASGQPGSIPTFPPTGSNHTPVAVPVGPVSAPEPIVPAGVPPSDAGISQPTFGTGNATTPAANGYFPSFAVVLLSPPLVPGQSTINSALFNNVTANPGHVPAWLLAVAPQTVNPAAPILTVSAVATIPQLPWAPGSN